jgi:hypothetical protein
MLGRTRFVGALLLTVLFAAVGSSAMANPGGNPRDPWWAGTPIPEELQLQNFVACPAGQIGVAYWVTADNVAFYGQIYDVTLADVLAADRNGDGAVCGFGSMVASGSDNLRLTDDVLLNAANVMNVNQPVAS